MANQPAQSFQNHRRNVPPFHFFALPVLMLNVIYRLVMLKNGITFDSIWSVLVAAAILTGVLFGRVFAITVQDRLIRLEMQLRLEKLLPADLRSRIGEFTVGQMVALRFAGDDELPALARQCLDEKLTNKQTIKGRVKNWRADFLRA